MASLPEILTDSRYQSYVYHMIKLHLCVMYCCCSQIRFKFIIGKTRSNEQGSNFSSSLIDTNLANSGIMEVTLWINNIFQYFVRRIKKITK